MGNSNLTADRSAQSFSRRAYRQQLFHSHVTEAKWHERLLHNAQGFSHILHPSDPYRGFNALPMQVNYLGHYALTRLLEPVLIASKPSRVVSVSSVTHRFTSIRDTAKFLTTPAAAHYQETKLAQVLFTFELQRRLGRFGVQVTHAPMFTRNLECWAACCMWRLLPCFQSHVLD